MGMRDRSDEEILLLLREDEPGRHELRSPKRFEGRGYHRGDPDSWCRQIAFSRVAAKTTTVDVTSQFQFNEQVPVALRCGLVEHDSELNGRRQTIVSLHRKFPSDNHELGSDCELSLDRTSRSSAFRD